MHFFTSTGPHTSSSICSIILTEPDFYAFFYFHRSTYFFFNLFNHFGSDRFTYFFLLWFCILFQEYHHKLRHLLCRLGSVLQSWVYKHTGFHYDIFFPKLPSQ